MSTRAIKPKRDDDPAPGGWKGLRERAPSLVRPDAGTTGRVVALIALFPLTLGVASLFFALIGKGYLISVSWGVLLLALGVAGLLYHAFNEKELQYRRLYGALGVLLLGLAVLFRVLPFEGVIGGRFVMVGAPCALLALGFLLSFARNETDSGIRNAIVTGLGAVGLAWALLGFVGGSISETFMLGNGVVLLVLGLLYLAAYSGIHGGDSPAGYRAGLGLGALGVLMILVALGWSVVPQLLFQLNWTETRPAASFFMPRGLILLYFGVEYLMLSVGVCSDNRLVVLTRRELAAFFYSPIAYIVIIGVTGMGWWVFTQFVGSLLEERGGSLLEPVIIHYTTGYFQIFSVVFMVPLLTMRLMSEERRTGSLEVLLTAPVNETSVVLSKFFAALRVFMLAWYPSGLFLLALRVEGGETFDYRPLLTFFISLIFMAAGWLAMGLFFSSLTRNQIAAAFLTLTVMIALTGLFWVKQNVPEGGTLFNVLQYVSFIDLWINSSFGNLTPRYLLFHLSFAVFFLFLSVKILEARKWA